MQPTTVMGQSTDASGPGPFQPARLLINDMLALITPSTVTSRNQLLNILLILSYTALQWMIGAVLSRHNKRADSPNSFDVMFIAHLVSAMLLVVGCSALLSAGTIDRVVRSGQFRFNAIYMLPTLMVLQLVAATSTNWAIQYGSVAGYLDSQYQLQALAPVILWGLAQVMDTNVVVPRGLDLGLLVLAACGRVLTLIDTYVSDDVSLTGWLLILAATTCTVARLVFIGKSMRVHGSILEMLLFDAVGSTGYSLSQLIQRPSSFATVASIDLQAASLMAMFIVLLAAQIACLVLIVARLGSLPAAVAFAFTRTVNQLGRSPQYEGWLDYTGLGMTLIGSAVYLIRCTYQVRYQVLQQQDPDVSLQMTQPSV